MGILGDIAAFLLDSNNKFNTVSNVIFFNNPNGQGITLGGDNRTGAGDGDDERILIDLQAIDSNIAKIAFVVTIHNAQAKRQTFGMIDNSYVRLLEAENNEKDIIIVGLQTDKCINATVISGFEYGFNLIVPAFANSTINNNYMDSQKSYRYYNEFMWHERYAECISIEETIKRMNS